jgi:DNA polymerase-1
MKYITEVEELSKNISELNDKPILGVDCETTGLCPHQSKLRLLQISDGDNTLVIDVRKIGVEATAHYVGRILNDTNISKTFHNAKFDLKFIKQQLGIDVERVFDTYLSSLIIEGGVSQIKGYHALGSVAERFAKERINKDEQVSDWSGELSESQLKYAAKDVEILFPVRDAQLKLLKELGLTRCAKIEFDAILPIAYLELCGFYLDLNEWITLADSQLAKAEAVALKIQEQIAPFIEQGSLFDGVGINLDSHVHIQKYFRLLGIPMPESTREFMLLPLCDKYPIIQDLLDYRGFIKSHGTFGANFADFVNPVTGRIHADFMQIGAATGRLAPSRPNLNQIPSDKEHRNCFKPQEGNVLVSNDYSQEELRILADFSGDENFRAIFASGLDFHTATAAQIFKIPVEKVTKDERSLAKRMNFGLTYGMGVAKFAKSANITESEADIIMKAYFSTFKKVERWLKYQKVQVLSSHHARTASGRMVRYVWDDSDRMARSSVQREAANSPIQGTGADILKRAIRIFYDATKDKQKDIKFVNFVHDEINIEVREDLAEEMSQLLKDCMVTAGAEFIKNVEVKVDVTIQNKWEK